MNNDIQVKYFDKEIKCPYETAADSILALFGIYEKTVVAIRINNEICPLKTKIALDSSIEPVFLDSPEGAMLYRRSLAFLLAVAAQKLYPNRILSIGHSLGNSYYYTFHSGKPPTEKEVSALGEVMESIVLENLPIEFKYLSYQQAMDMFAKNRQEDTVSLLYQRCTARVKVNECKGFADIFFEPLAPSTGLLSSFRLMPYQEGFLLLFPAVGKGMTIDPFKDEPAIFNVYNEYKKWGRIAGVRTVGDLNEKIAGKTIQEYISIAETHQARKLSEIAQQINKLKEDVKIILLAGPSSSGKTTSAKRLIIELMVLGIKPIAISLDNYFVGVDQTPKDKNGEPDYECLEALDIQYFNEQLIELFSGKEITMPVYDFKTGRSSKTGGKKISLGRRTVIIAEGIHAINDALTPGIAKETKFKLYVSALAQLNLDNHNRIPTSDYRLLRRLVRDYQFRGKDAVATFKMWKNVQAGERKYIFPHQNTVDAAFNSALDYELSVLKYYADPILRAVKPDQRDYSEASRLLSFLKNFTPIPPQHVPGNSIIREFIGGSDFKY